jgi:hypothetical protein
MSLLILLIATMISFRYYMKIINQTVINTYSKIWTLCAAVRRTPGWMREAPP